MSWRASAWAKEQRLGSPAAKSILLCLADYADPDKAQCWPSQTQLASDAEVSERTAREWLQRLEDWGLIARERRTRPNGARAADMIVLKLDRHVRDGAERCRGIKEEEPDDRETLPANSAGRTNRQPDAGPTGNEAQPTGNQCRAYKEEPSKEPPIGTSQPGAQAREREGIEEDRKKIDADGWALLKDWPGFAGMPKEPAMRIWRSMAAEDRAAAARRFPHWLALLKAQRKSHVPAPSTYLSQRLWTEVPEPAEQAKLDEEAAPFGKLWQAARMKQLLSGPQAAIPRPTSWQQKAIEEGAIDAAELMRERQAEYGWPAVKAMHGAAQFGKPVTVATTLRPLADLMDKVLVGSELWEAWRLEHRLRGWPWLPDPGKHQWVYFPAGGPEALPRFEAALRGEASESGQDDAAGSEAAE